MSFSPLYHLSEPEEAVPLKRHSGALFPIILHPSPAYRAPTWSQITFLLHVQRLPKRRSATLDLVPTSIFVAVRRRHAEGQDEAEALEGYVYGGTLVEAWAFLRGEATGRKA